MNYTTKADKIVNMLISEYGIDLKTVDAHDIREAIVTILQDAQLPETPTLGARCQVMKEGTLWNATVTELLSGHYSAVISGTDVLLSNIPFKKWRPI